MVERSLGIINKKAEVASSILAGGFDNSFGCADKNLYKKSHFQQNMAYINNIVDELNPVKDMQHINFRYNHLFNPEAGRQEYMLNSMHNILVLGLSVAKPLARGYIFGGAAGAAAAYITGNDPFEGFMGAGGICCVLDVFQYDVRLFMKHIRAVNKERERH